MKIVRKGYSYIVRKSKTDLQAMVQISSRLFRRFVERCGSVNTIGKPGLTVAYQGGGYYLVFTVNDAKSPMVTEFLARLNRWANKEQQDKPFSDALYLSSAQRGSPYRLEVSLALAVNKQEHTPRKTHQGGMALAWSRMLNTHFGTRQLA